MVVDSDADGQPTDDADGDDIDQIPNDDDGFTVLPRLTAGENSSIDVVASTSGRLDGWIDLNRNGAFEHPGEHVNSGISLDLIAGTNSIVVQVPQDAALGATYFRLRVSSSGSLAPTGFAPTGEVEDYYVAIRPANSESDWQNPAEPFDSNGDGAVSPIDALVIINTINSDGSRDLTALAGVPMSWYDVNGDGSVSPIDVLQVINQLNSASAEGETTASTPLLVAGGIQSIANNSDMPAARRPLLSTLAEQRPNSLPFFGNMIDSASRPTKPLFVSARESTDGEQAEFADLDSELDKLMNTFFVFGGSS